MTAGLFFWATCEPATVSIQLSLLRRVYMCIYRTLNSTVLSCTLFPLWQRQKRRLKLCKHQTGFSCRVILGCEIKLREHAWAWLRLQDKSQTGFESSDLRAFSWSPCQVTITYSEPVTCWFFLAAMTPRRSCRSSRRGAESWRLSWRRSSARPNTGCETCRLRMRGWGTRWRTSRYHWALGLLNTLSALGDTVQCLCGRLSVSVVLQLSFIGQQDK